MVKNKQQLLLLTADSNNLFAKVLNNLIFMIPHNNSTYYISVKIS